MGQPLLTEGNKRNGNSLPADAGAARAPGLRTAAEKAEAEIYTNWWPLYEWFAAAGAFLNIASAKILFNERGKAGKRTKRRRAYAALQ